MGSLLGSLGGGSVGPSINGIVSALENGGAASLLPGQIGTALHNLPGSVAALPGLQGLLQPAATTGGVGPYQTLLQNTVANLQTFTSAISANPNPFLHQFITNQMSYAQTIASQLAYVAQNFPAVLAGLPASIQAGIQGLLAFNPSPYVQQIIINQMIYAELTYSSLQSAGGYFTAGLQALPPHLESAFQFTLAGNYTAAQGQLFQGVLGLLVAPPGAVVTGQTESLTITTQHYALLPSSIADLPTSVTGNAGAGIVPVGTVGSLLPILTIPGMEAQNFTNLLPGGSIAQQIAQNFTNAVKTVSDTSIALTGVLDLGLDWGGGPCSCSPLTSPLGYRRLPWSWCPRGASAGASHRCGRRPGQRVGRVQCQHAGVQQRGAVRTLCAGGLRTHQCSGQHHQRLPQWPRRAARECRTRRHPNYSGFPAGWHSCRSHPCDPDVG